MKKFLTLIAATILFIACGDDNPSSPLNKTESSGIYSSSDIANSSSSESINDGKRIISWTQSRDFSFLDTIHLRYYHLDYDCIYNESTNSFSWVSDKYIGIVDIDTLFKKDSYSGHSSFGYMLSNDTLYECDYIAAKCDNVSEMEAATVYTGSSKSLLGTWNYVGRIKDGIFYTEENFSNVEMTITAKGTTEKISYIHETEPLFYSNHFCNFIYDLFDEEQGYAHSKLCYNYFNEITKQDGIYTHFNKEANTHESIPDTVKLGDNYWVTAVNDNEIILFVEDMTLKVNYNEDILENPITMTADMTVSNGEKSCEHHSTQTRMTKEFCEAASYDPSKIALDHCNATGKDEKILKSYSDNDNEFRQCIKQFSKTE